MTIQIRPHHLLCLLTYLGKGYSDPFVQNYDRLVESINNGEDMQLVDGPDDICQPMLSSPECHCHNESVRERDRIAARDIGMLLMGEPFSAGPLRLTAPDIARLRAAFAEGTVRAACQGCEWQDLCTNIARKQFRGCRLQLPLL
ncbi:DUF1284 domain-containing protein [Roseibium denhamense]|uniref:DUF1284 domain-containing protein n=1 Tax=Roseibium denhamense TaxID=76305 RepID=A0ABY1PEI1_9HYPH|nr:DUF1284 domain-containing protein [Roseibium denhamense]MTI06193.1 DUF1284 domain-containing protein [Roseibium denhamense]SMP32450.1 hypothetical protein SAMN06265374_3546 [Roseibium denhamense]